ncbi:MAG: hypothetical protein M1327_06590 [Candidatus Thermoplasmatota archaeon]|nr:hypothetical protein [Candidatus Thermoplasmatota archaeon]
MPDPDPVPDEFDAESKAYFGNQESRATRNTKGVVKQDAVVADIRSLMSRGNRGYYLVKSYALDEINAILFESCKQLNSLGLRPELAPNLEKALQRNDSGEPKIRIITEDYIDFSNVRNKETVAQIINGNAGLHLDGVYLVIGIAEQTYRKLAKPSRELIGSRGNAPKFYELISANSIVHRYYITAILVTLIFGLTYTFYSAKLFSAGFDNLAVMYIVLWFLVPFIFFIVFRKEHGHRQLYVIPLIAAFLSTLMSGGIQGSSVSSSGPFIYYGYPFLYYDYYRAQVPRGALFTSHYLVFGFSWLGLFLDLIAWFCISIIAAVIAATVWSKYGRKILSKITPVPES